MARGALLLLTGTFAARALDLVLYVLLARTLGVESFGRYAYALSFTLLFGALADLGLSTVFTREVARTPDRTRELLISCLWIKLALSVVTLAMVAGAVRLDAAAAQTLPLIVPMAVGMLLHSAALLFDGMLRASGRAGRSGVGLVLQSVAALVAGAGLLGLGWGPRAGAIAFLGGAIARVASAAWWSRDLWAGSQRLPGSGRGVPLLRETAPLALATVFVAIYFRIDTVVLRVFQGEHAVGLYAGIYRVFEGLALLAVTCRSLLFPVMARAADGPSESLAVLCRRTVRVQLLFTLGVAVFISFHASGIVQGILGPDYGAAAPGLVLLIWALPGSYMADTLLFLLTAQRRQAWGTWAVGLTALLNVTLNLALVPRFSFLGAAVATVASEWLCFALLLFMFQRSVPMLGLGSVAWRPVLACALLSLFLALGSRWTPGGMVGLAVAGVGAAGVYGLLLVALGAVNRRDLDWMRQLLARRPS
jgi:O-antigen/teichoic acid export membrane protein